MKQDPSLQSASQGNPSFLSLLPDYSSAIYGRVVDISLGQNVEFSARSETAVTTDWKLVKVDAVKVAGFCRAADLFLVLPGEGEPSDGGCNAHPVGQRMWRWPADKPLHILSVSSGTLSGLATSEAQEFKEVVEAELLKDLKVEFKNLRQSGDRLTGDAVITWTVKIGGTKVKLIEESIPFSIVNKKTIWEDVVTVLGIEVKVWVDAYWSLKPKRICVRLNYKSIFGKGDKEHCETF
jgi:hypothetical protein